MSEHLGFNIHSHEIQLNTFLADAPTRRRAEREWVGLSDVPQGALPCKAFFPSLSDPAPLPVPAAKPAALLGLSLELVRAPGSPFSRQLRPWFVLAQHGPGTE